MKMRVLFLVGMVVVLVGLRALGTEATLVVFVNGCARPVDVVYTVINSTEDVFITFKDRVLLEEEYHEQRRLRYSIGADDGMVLGPSTVLCSLGPRKSCTYDFDADHSMTGGKVTAGRRGKTAARFGWDVLSGAEFYDHYRLSRVDGFDVGMRLTVTSHNQQHAIQCRHSMCSEADNIPHFAPTGGRFHLTFCPA